MWSVPPRHLPPGPSRSSAPPAPWGVCGRPRCHQQAWMLARGGEGLRPWGDAEPPERGRAVGAPPYLPWADPCQGFRPEASSVRARDFGPSLEDDSRSRRDSPRPHPGHDGAPYRSRSQARPSTKAMGGGRRPGTRQGRPCRRPRRRGTHPERLGAEIPAALPMPSGPCTQGERAHRQVRSRLPLAGTPDCRRGRRI